MEKYFIELEVFLIIFFEYFINFGLKEIGKIVYFFFILIY